MASPIHSFSTEQRLANLETDVPEHLQETEKALLQAAQSAKLRYKAAFEQYKVNRSNGQINALKPKLKIHAIPSFTLLTQSGEILLKRTQDEIYSTIGTEVISDDFEIEELPVCVTTAARSADKQIQSLIPEKDLRGILLDPSTLVFPNKSMRTPGGGGAVRPIFAITILKSQNEFICENKESEKPTYVWVKLRDIFQKLDQAKEIALKNEFCPNDPHLLSSTETSPIEVEGTTQEHQTHFIKIDSVVHRTLNFSRKIIEKQIQNP